jgi:elongation factor P
MAQQRVTELKKGMVVNLDGELFVITKYDHITPGNWRAIHMLSLKSLRSGNQKQMRCSTSDMLEVAYLDKKTCQYLYKDPTGFVFMDMTTYEQHTLSPDLVEEAMKFLKENDEVQVTFYEGAAMGIEVAPTVVLEITESEDAVKGNSVTNLQKVAKLETGLEIKVPLHIKQGEKVKVSTSTGEFMGRA